MANRQFMKMSATPNTHTFQLNTGSRIPAVGLGTWQSTETEGFNAVKTALQAGYRHIDLAWRYGNRKAVREGIQASGVPRETLFITDKVWQTWHSRAAQALDESLQSLGVEYLDLWLMHWPLSFNPNGNDPGVPKLQDGSRDLESDWDFIKTWQLMESIYLHHPDKIRAIGVSNCSTKHLEQILAIAKIVPAVDQIELHPSLPQHKLAEFCRVKGIQLVAHSPLGSPDSKLLTEKTLVEIGARHGVTAAQCLISWGIQKGWAVLPKSSNPARIVSNLKTPELSAGDIAAIDELGKSTPKRYVKPAWAHDIWHDDE